jgi:hypothetical protein
MSRHERRYQKYLERQRQKHGHGAAETRATAQQVAAAAAYPVYEALVPENLFALGLGHLVFSRLQPDGRIAFAAFLVDVFCLGVKDAFVTILSRDEYARHKRGWAMRESFRPIEPACFRKRVEGAVAYARELGFSPHADYALASQIFAGVQVMDCPTRFEYGQEGKPLYVSGPYETPARVEAILDQLERRLGPEGFHYLVGGG